MMVMMTGFSCLTQKASGLKEQTLHGDDIEGQPVVSRLQGCPRVNGRNSTLFGV